jgi:hypothetical protein
MARIGLLRRRGLLLGALAALAAALIQPLPAAAATTGTLFGIVFQPIPGVARIDPVSGTTTLLADLSLPPGHPSPGFSAGLVDDPTSHRLFLVRVVLDFTLPPPNNTTSQLVTVDSRTGAMTVQTLSQGLAGLAFDPSTGTLFGVTAGNCCPNTLPISIVRVDPSTGAETSFASVTGDAIGLMSVDPASHSIYATSDSFATIPNTIVILTVNTLTGAVTQSPVLNPGIPSLVFDSSAGALYGTTFCCPAHFAKVDPSTGSETLLGSYDFGMFLHGAGAIDAASHTVFVVQDVFDPLNPQLGPVAHIASINDQTGAGVLGQTTGTNVGGLAFEPVLITPASIQADVQKAAADGSIKTKALADSLLDKLARAAEARTDGNCKAAGRIYEAFIDQVTRQSGKKIAPATATQLASEAQFLITNCP